MANFCGPSPILRDSLSSLHLTFTYVTNVTLYSNWESTDINLPFSKMYYVKNGGGGVVECNGESFRLEGNKIYLIPTGTTHSFFLEDPSEKSPMNKFFVHLNLKDDSGYDILRNIRKILVLQTTPEYIEEICNLANQINPTELIILKSHIFSDIAKMIRQEKITFSSNTYSEKVQIAIEIICSNPSYKQNAKSIAKQLYVSESFLVKKFKQEVGVTIGKYIQQILLFAVQTELLQTNNTCFSICNKFGFNDKYYFSKWFKSLTAETPTEYRLKRQSYRNNKS